MMTEETQFLKRKNNFRTCVNSCGKRAARAGGWTKSKGERSRS